MTDNNKLPTIQCSRCGKFFGFGKITDGEVYLLCNCKNQDGDKRWVAVVGEKQSEMEAEAMSQRIHNSIEEVKRMYYGECEVYDAKSPHG